VVAGGWLEGLFISVNVALNNKNNTDILNRIADQKVVLESLSGLLESYKSDPEVAKFITELSPLKAAFAKAGQTTVSEGEISTDEAAGKTTLPEASSATISPELLAEITKVTMDIRGKITR
jgi:TPP-dependent trihydroxycyclohexane-1,2-dione (THcHDO) dehydratase